LPNLAGLDNFVLSHNYSARLGGTLGNYHAVNIFAA